MKQVFRRPQLNPRAIALLRKAKKRILARPKEYDYSVFFERRAGGKVCGCIITHVIVAARQTKLAQSGESGINADLAARLLGLDKEMGQRLFIFWPDGFKVSSPKDAARRIDHFIKTGE